MSNLAIVVKVNNIKPHPNADNLQIVSLLGTQVITGKDTKEGDIMIYFDSNLRLSHSYLTNNNLYRDPLLNHDSTKKGYFEDNGRVKAIKLRGEFSDGILMPLESLNFIYSFNSFSLTLGEQFDTLYSEKICEKYIPVRSKTPGLPHEKTPPKSSIESRMFKEHYDTGQFFREKHNISPGIVHIIEKTHGTSGRVGYVSMNVTSTYKTWKINLLSIIGRLLDKRIGSISIIEYGYLHGSRRVVYTNDVVNPGYHDNTMRSEVFNKVKGLLLKGQEIYFELYGYEKTGAQIQKGFTYGCKPGEYKAKLYRVTMNNEDGAVVDYPLEYVINMAKELGMEYPHVFESYYYDGTEESMKILEQKVIDYAQGQSVLDPDTLKEGVIVQFINKRGLWDCLKYKSDAFRAKESGDRDKGIIDQEDIN